MTDTHCMRSEACKTQTGFSTHQYFPVFVFLQLACNVVCECNFIPVCYIYLSYEFELSVGLHTICPLSLILAALAGE